MLLAALAGVGIDVNNIRVISHPAEASPKAIAGQRLAETVH